MAANGTKPRKSSTHKTQAHPGLFCQKAVKMASKPETINAIIDVLSTVSPMTKDELSEYLGKKRNTVQASIYWERQQRGAEKLHIVEYRPMRGKGGKPQAVYAAGPGKDAEKPRLVDRQKAANKRYREANKEIIAARQRLRRSGKTAADNPFSQILRAFK
jgi:hypothetical protein